MKRIFIDPAKCDGCRNCTIACMASHQDMTPRKGTLAEIRQAVYALDLTDLSVQSRNRILSDGRGGYSPIFCRHCDIPDCAGACMSGALEKSMETGLVEYKSEKEVFAQVRHRVQIYWSGAYLKSCHRVKSSQE